MNHWVDTVELKSSLRFDYKIEPALGIVTRNRSDRGARWAGKGDLRRTFVLTLRTSQNRGLGTCQQQQQARTKGFRDYKGNSPGFRRHSCS